MFMFSERENGMVRQNQNGIHAELLIQRRGARWHNFMEHRCLQELKHVDDCGTSPFHS